MPNPHVLVGILAALLIFGKFAVTGEDEEIPLASYQSHDSLAVQGRSKISWKEAVGQQVIAQGIAWGKSEKGLGDRVILDGTTIYVAKPAALDKQGRLVEVSGKLEKLRVPPAPSTSGGFGPKGLEYYAISGAKWRYVDAVSSPRLVLQGQDAAVK
jgi:hypothetical protein